jgi:dipeptidyl-peptidase-3
MGARILSATISPESPLLLDLFLLIFSSMSIQQLREKTATVDSADFQHFLDYACQVLNNLGNYKSFGDVKFIPRLDVSQFLAIVKACNLPKALEYFEQLKTVIYSVEPEESLLIGYPADKHVSGYYSNDIGKSDVDFCQKVLEEHGISALNTRLFKTDKGYKVLIASADTNVVKSITVGEKIIEVVHGDFAREMSLIAEYMSQAIPFASNDNQRKMIEAYVSSYKTGSIEDHKESQRHWIRDVGPVVETNIGFIETYRDPAGVRAEWEGFVAVVNKEMTKKFEALVQAAPEFIKLLPWKQEFEKDAFMKPDFTSLEVVTFATSGSPPSGM